MGDYQPPHMTITNDPSSNSKWMLDYHIGEMVKAEGNHDWWRYWVEFKFVLERMLAYIKPEDRMKIDEDFRQLAKYTRAIQNQVGPDQKSKDIQIEKLRLSFIDSHRAYTGLYLSKTGLIVVEEAGDLNFQKHDFEKLERIVRAGSEPSVMERTVEQYESQKAKKEEKDATANTGDTAGEQGKPSSSG